MRWRRRGDGRIPVGGWFGSLAGRPRSNLGRLHNIEPATQSLDYDGATITWQRGDTCPEVWRTTFDLTTGDDHWIPLGEGTQTSAGWSLGGLALLPAGQVRARGYVTGGHNNGSTWDVGSLLAVDPTLPPRILSAPGSLGFVGGEFASHIVGLAEQEVVVEGSTDLTRWFPLATNTLSASPLHFTDPGASHLPTRFYRARLR